MRLHIGHATVRQLGHWKAEGIEKRVTPSGLHHADEVMKRGVLLPVHHGMTNEMFNRLHETIEEFIAQF